MKKIIVNLIEYIGDLIRFFLFNIRAIMHGRVKYPLVYDDNGEVCVLGNGPSLKSYLQTNKGNVSDSICVNFSPLTEEFYRIRPKYLILIDHAFFHAGDKSVQELSSAIKENVTWELTIIINKPHLKSAEKLYGCEAVSFRTLPQITFEPRTKLFLNVKHRLFRKGLTMPSAQNVAIAAIFTAINAGYKTICLYGLDHSWLKDTYVSKNNIPCLKDKHFYGEKDVPWAFDSDGTPWKMYQLLSALSLVFKGYYDLKTYAEYLGGIRIINKAKDSWIDAFERET